MHACGLVQADDGKVRLYDVQRQRFLRSFSMGQAAREELSNFLDFLQFLPNNSARSRFRPLGGVSLRSGIVLSECGTPKLSKA
jgi:hypothetical protein